MISISLQGPRFLCPACGGVDCTYAGTKKALEWDLPCTCDRCGARVHLQGFPRYLICTLSLMGAFVGFYFTGFMYSWKISPVLGLLGMAIVIYGVIQLHDRVVRKLAAWELAPAVRPDGVRDNDDRGWETPLSVALSRDWIYLLGAPLFGPFVFVVVPLYDLPMSATGIMFFAMLLPVMWPILAGRASLAFWVLGLVLWMAGFGVGIALEGLLQPG